MPRSIDEAETALLEGRLKIKINPALRSAILGARVRRDPTGTLRMLVKPPSQTKIDAAVALVMACGLADFFRNKAPQERCWAWMTC